MTLRSFVAPGSEYSRRFGEQIASRIAMIENRSGGTSSRSGTIRHRRRASLHLAIPWNGIANGAILFFWLSWPGSRTKRGLGCEHTPDWKTIKIRAIKLVYPSSAKT